MFNPKFYTRIEKPSIEHLYVLLRLYEKQRLAEVTAVKQRLSDSLRGVAKGVIKPVPQRDAMKVCFLSKIIAVGSDFRSGDEDAASRGARTSAALL